MAAGEEAPRGFRSRAPAKSAARSSDLGELRHACVGAHALAGSRLDWIEAQRTSGARDQVFRHRSRSGRIALERNGNAVEVTSRGVEEFTLLLSPAQFDLSQPVKVTTNGRVALEQRVEKSVATLMKWAARRTNNRTMLFGAEVKVRVR